MFLTGPLKQYMDLVQQGKLQHDPYQEKVALELENLLGRLEQYEKDMEEYHVISLANDITYELFLHHVIVRCFSLRQSSLNGKARGRTSVTEFW